MYAPDFNITGSDRLNFLMPPCALRPLNEAFPDMWFDADELHEDANTPMNREHWPEELRTYIEGALAPFQGEPTGGGC